MMSSRWNRKSKNLDLLLYIVAYIIVWQQLFQLKVMLYEYLLKVNSRISQIGAKSLQVGGPVKSRFRSVSYVWPLVSTLLKFHPWRQNHKPVSYPLIKLWLKTFCCQMENTDSEWRFLCVCACVGILSYFAIFSQIFISPDCFITLAFCKELCDLVWKALYK